MQILASALKFPENTLALTMFAKHVYHLAPQKLETKLFQSVYQLIFHWLHWRVVCAFLLNLSLRLSLILSSCRAKKSPPLTPNTNEVSETNESANNPSLTTKQKNLEVGCEKPD
ncbi:MAG TPA: hypothetical protein DCY88_34950 [Cyanobacteria bacterium UBA11372]|nr:hypothetical protein [Cyanobacteria bacterium UBA11372]